MGAPPARTHPFRVRNPANRSAGRRVVVPLITPGVAAALAVTMVGCSGRAEVSTASLRPSAVRIEVRLGPGDIAQHAVPRRNGHVQLSPILARCGIIGITGTHAEFVPERPLCRVRVRALNDDASFHTLSTRAQRLVLADGRLVEESPDAMRIKRQPDTIELGAHNAAEFDVWFEPALGAGVRAIRLVGDQDPDPPGTSVNTATGPRSGVEVPLTGI